MDDILAARMAERLLADRRFSDLPAMTRPMNTVWTVLNNTLLVLRLPIYHLYLGKPAPKRAVREAAIQSALAMLATFADCVGTKQSIITSHGGHAHAISFQPRPFGINWTARHAIASADDAQLSHGPNVGIDDMLFLAVKVTCAIAGYQAGHMAPSTTTFLFGAAHPAVVVIVREMCGHQHRAQLEE